MASIFCLLLTVTTLSAQDEVGDILGRINNLRASLGLPAYNLNGALSAAAQSQSQWLIDNDCTIAHTHPDGSSPRSRAQAAGYASSEVGENIYCGGIAQVDDAWTFWINSPIHYAGLVNTRYKEVGIGVAHGANGSGFTLVFGNPGGSAYVPPPPASAAGAQNVAASGPAQQPSYVVGLDEHGNIKHEIQDGDTIGDILLIYGYTWADIPTLLALNNMTQEDFRSLKVGTILLIPPKAGTYTPTPGDAPPTSTPEAPTVEQPTSESPTSESPTQAAPELVQASIVESPIPPTSTEIIVPPTENSVIQQASFPQPTDTAVNPPAPATAVVQVALAATAIPVSVQKSAGVVASRPGTSPALIVALVVQAGILLGAGFEFVRRMRRRKS